MASRSIDMNRRGFLAAAGIGTLGAAAGHRAATAATGTGADFAYEITRSEEEWRARLSDEEYRILRGGGTELPRSSELWDDMRAGEFRCRGCDLHVYSSNWRAPVDKVLVFFAHAVPNAVLMYIDGPQEAYGMSEDWANLIETHCRRCGSHLGHILLVDGEVLHCINGAALAFTPSEA